MPGNSGARFRVESEEVTSLVGCSAMAEAAAGDRVYFSDFLQLYALLRRCTAEFQLDRA